LGNRLDTPSGAAAGLAKRRCRPR